MDTQLRFTVSCGSEALGRGTPTRVSVQLLPPEEPPEEARRRTAAQCERAEQRAEEAAATASQAWTRERQQTDWEAAARSDERSAAAARELRQEAAALTQQLQAVQEMELGLRDRLDAAEALVLMERQTAGRLRAELHAAHESHVRELSHKVPPHIAVLPKCATRGECCLWLFA